MDSVLIVGVETVVGANLAATLATRHSVSAISRHENQSWSYGPFACCPRQAAAAHYVRIRQQAPLHVVYCGNGAHCCWDSMAIADESETLIACLDAAKAMSASFTLISSDGVLTGPWMFHAENSQSICPSLTARLLRDAEQHVLDNDPRALVIRTHCFGWSPIPGLPTWLNRVMHNLERQQPLELDPVPHASPLLASDLADILSKIWRAGLNGLYHVSGAERTNPVRFAQRLAMHAGWAMPQGDSAARLQELPAGFGCGETSLQTRKIRRALGITLPMLNEGISRLYEQQASGFAERLQGRHSTARAA